MDICYDEEPNISETKGVKLLQISKEFVGIISSTRHIKEGGIQISFVFMLYFKGKNKKENGIEDVLKNTWRPPKSGLNAEKSFYGLAFFSKKFYLLPAGKHPPMFCGLWEYWRIYNWENSLCSLPYTLSVILLHPHFLLCILSTNYPYQKLCYTLLLYPFFWSSSMYLLYNFIYPNKVYSCSLPDLLGLPLLASLINSMVSYLFVPFCFSTFLGILCFLDF